MSSTITVFTIIFSVILGNFLCADVNNRNIQQNAWHSVNTSIYDYNAQVWPALGSRKNQQNVQTSTKIPQWIRPNNGPNWVRNTPSPQNSKNSPQHSNIPSKNSITPVENSNIKPQLNSNINPPRNSNTRPTDYNTMFLNNERSPNRNMGSTNSRSNSDNVQSTQKRTNGNFAGGNSIIFSGSAITNTEGNKGKKQETGSSQTDDIDDNELRQFSEDLLNKDSNNAAQYVNVNLQGITTSRSTADQAPLPLLSINKAAYSIPSISKLLLLYNNYIVESNQNEVYTAQEKNEENDLLDIILQTPVMQYTRNFLIGKGKIGRDPKEFKDLLRRIWFNMYSRGGGKIGSSGFEHVFLTELKNNQVSGLHNWIYFNEEEQKNNANYLGYMKKIDLSGKGAILKFHFTFQGVDKPVGSMFIGTSPELEIALYSTCFILRPDKICPLKMNGNRFIIRTYTYRYRGKNMIGSAFPEI
ncbi:endoribonuclease CG2145-like isoform X1 [Diorhabda carinulata]|uniref:endoribonuclease CG2145-like isoform X1 n=1 Tax=Diorhabda carinulata TaxID=1163345 RepID=UPI00259FE43F|nr:endoribonuclease CG2145-like isoform X1 [Diorhabda carinulata]